MHRTRLLIACVAMLVVTAGQVQAGIILFVSDDPGTSSSLDISSVLQGDGHTVTNVLGDYDTGNTALLGALGSYDAVYWAASGPGFGGTHAAGVIANLSSYVTGGGNVFVTGYDSASSPSDPVLYGFLGATGQFDVPPAPGAISLVGNSLTTGVVDITGLTPTGAWGDRDTLTGLTAGTIGVTAT